MASQEVKRKLAAILSADVKEYSRLMSQDEVGTIRTLDAYKNATSEIVVQYKGRVVDSTGDNLMAEFASVVDAVNCAVEVQRELAERNVEIPNNRRMEFRIGINLGDVVEEQGRIYGDGVNIAARLQSLAEGGGICISGTVYDQVKSKLGLEYEHLGEQTVKNIAEPVRAYRVLSFPGAAAYRVVQARSAVVSKYRRVALAIAVLLLIGVASVLTWHFFLRPPSVEVASKEKMVFPLPDVPSIAVLPFANMSGDPKQEFLCDGMTEEIITALSKSPYLFVIARQSTFAYKGKPMKVKQVSEELGVRYVLEGSVRRSGEKVRVAAQLIDAMTGYHLWAERYDRDLKDIFALQDEIALKILKTVHEKLQPGDHARVLGRGTRNLEAFLKAMEARGHFYRVTKEDNALARKLYEEAIALDPNYAYAYAGLAWTYWTDTLFGKPRKESLTRAIELCERAIALDESEAAGHAFLGYFYVVAGQFDRGVAQAERGLALDPNSYGVLYNSGTSLAYSGRPEEAIPLLHKAIRLNPFGAPWSFFTTLSTAYRMVGRFDEAVEQAKKGVERDPKNQFTYLTLASACILAGREAEARAAATEVLKINPKFSLEQYANDTLILPYRDKSFVARTVDALSKAGLK
jgi:TolB-like protein/class 3 adenylate cyclase/Tfp pilus assembly protein PilF